MMMVAFVFWGWNGWVDGWMDGGMGVAMVVIGRRHAFHVRSELLNMLQMYV